METVGLSHTAVLYALGWAIAHSLWQMGLLWLIYQLFLGLPKNVKPAYRYGGAVLFITTGFIWFGITVADQFYTYLSINRYIEQLPVADGAVFSPEIIAGGASGEIFSKVFSTFEGFIPYLSGGYLTVLILLFVRLINAYGYTQKIRTHGLTPAGDFWDNRLLQFTNKLGLSQNIKVYLTALIDVPATIGFFKPVILLPIATINHLSTEQVESIILHELAHIRRQDYLLNILISILETILFFNPFAYLLVNVVKKERELFCDDFVVAFKNDPHSYATALLHLEKLRKGSTALLAVAATGHDGVLLNRVKRIMKVNAQPFQYREKLIALFFISFLLSTLAWLDPVPSTNNRSLTASVKNDNEPVAEPLTLQDLITKSEIKEADTEKAAPTKAIATVKLKESNPALNLAPSSVDAKPLERFDLQASFNDTYVSDYPASAFGSAAPRNPNVENIEPSPFVFDNLPMKKYAPYPFPGDSVNVIQLFKSTSPDQENEFNQLIEKALQLSAAQKPVPFEILSRIEQLKEMRFSFHFNEKNRRMKERSSAIASDAPQPDVIYFNEPPMHPEEREKLTTREYHKAVRGTGPVQRSKGRSYIIIDDKNLLKGGSTEENANKKQARKGKPASSAPGFYIGDEMFQSFGAATLNGWGINKDSSVLQRREGVPDKRKIRLTVGDTPTVNSQFYIAENIRSSDNIRSTSPARVITRTKKPLPGKASATQKITISIETSNELISIEFDQNEQEE
jgi:Zn-dependent protease with chaperone function